MLQFTIPTIEKTGSLKPSKVAHLISPKIINNLNIFHSRTLFNKMLFSIAFNGKKDSSHKVAKTDLLHKATLSSCKIPNLNKFKLNQEWLIATVEPSRWKTLPQVNTSSELFPSMDPIKAMIKSGSLDPSQKKLVLKLTTEATHTNEANQIGKYLQINLPNLN